MARILLSFWYSQTTDQLMQKAFHLTLKDKQTEKLTLDTTTYQKTKTIKGIQTESI